MSFAEVGDECVEAELVPNLMEVVRGMFQPVPHMDALRGLTLTQMERKLRHDFGYSRSQARHFIWQHKARLLNG